MLHRLKKRSGAIGFAVYLDRLERLEEDTQCKNYDADVVLQYEQGISPTEILKIQSKLVSDGNRVITASDLDPTLRYRRLIKITNGGTQTLEIHD